MKKTKKTTKNKKIKNLINPDESSLNHTKIIQESSQKVIKKENIIESFEEKSIGFVERIQHLSQQVQMLVDQDDHDEKQYQLLKMMYNEDVNIKHALKSLEISEDELMYIVDELVEDGFLKYISDEEAEITEEGISYLKWRELNF